MKKLVDAMRQLVEARGAQWSDDLLATIPGKYERHGDLLLLPDHAFRHHVWDDLGKDVWKTVSSVLKCQRVARKSRIKNDGFRSPQVEMLLGTDSWVTHTDNKIRYSFDVQRCMFSSGNISEKLRIASWDCSGETVVDLYAGIGYFTLPYLVHARAALVYACEWNPASIEALKKNLAMNRVEEKCVVLQGDNTQTCPVGIADRVNLGLVPSSEGAWSIACSALRPDTGGVLHIHGNVESPLRQPPSPTINDRLTTEPEQSITPHQSATSRFSVTEKSSVDIPVESSSPKACTKQEVTKPNLVKFAKRCRMKEAWFEWGEECRGRVERLCSLRHDQPWSAIVVHLEHVKTYAPYIDHLVVDIRCTPAT